MAQDSSVRLLVSCGSLMIQTGAVPEAIHADAALVADVPQELSAVRLGTPAVAVALARGETTATLLERAYATRPELAELRQAILALGSVDLHDGLGSLASLGRIAGLVAIEHDRVREHIERELVIPVLRRRNGTLHRVAVWALNSLAGGVGALAGGVFTGLVAEQFRLLSHAIVDVLSFQVGALTFLGLGDRILDNTAAGLIEHLSILTDPDRHPRESRQLLLTELPTVDTLGHEISANRELRSTLAMSLAAAFAASQVQQQIQAGRTNRALGTSLRGVTVLRGDWFGSLSRNEVVADAARHYFAELDRPAQTGETLRPALDFVDAQVSPERKTSAELSALALNTRGAKPPAFENYAFAGVKFAVTVRIDGNSAEQTSENAVETALAGRPGQALDFLTAKQAEIGGALAEHRVRELREEMRAESLRRRLRASLAVLFPVGRWGAGWRFLTGARAAVDRFAEALNAWREAQERHALAAARVATLQASAQSIAAAFQRIQSLVARLRSALEAMAGPAARRSFTYAPLDAVSAGFLRCIASGDIPLLRSQLAGSVREVTPDGLAQIVKAPSAQPAEIVARLQCGAQFSAPFWGGADPSSPPFFRAIVLPPVGAAFLASLREAAVEAGLERDMLSGDTLAGGASVVGLEAGEVTSITDLFPAPYLSGLREIAGTKRSLYPLGDRAQLLVKRLLNGEAECA